MTSLSRRRLVPLAASAALAVLAACATPTPYAPLSGAAYGYSEQTIEPDRVRLSFRGNSLTNRDVVESYLLYRAAEVTLERGFDHFIAVTRDTEVDRRLSSFGGPFHPGFSPSYWYFSPRFGWRGRWDPFWDDVELREITRYEASAEIVMGRGPKPEGDANAFDARQVRANLESRIRRPAP